MPVEKDINLDKAITDEDIRHMEEDADRIEELAKKAQEDSEDAEKLLAKEDKILEQAVKTQEKIEKEVEKAEKAKLKIGRTIKEVNQLAEHRAGLTGFGGEEQFDETEGLSGFQGLGGTEALSGTLKKGRTAFGTGQESSPIGEILKRQETAHQMMKKAEEERKAMQKLMKDNQKTISDLGSKVQEASGFASNPFSFLMSKMRGTLGGAGVAGFIAIIGIAVAQQVFKLIEAQFAPGGRFDIRKMMLDRDREIAELEHILDRRAGRVFFTSDLELKQGVVQTSNTERLADRMSRYQALHLGE